MSNSRYPTAVVGYVTLVMVDMGYAVLLSVMSP